MLAEHMLCGKKKKNNIFKKVLKGLEGRRVIGQWVPKVEKRIGGP